VPSHEVPSIQNSEAEIAMNKDIETKERVAEFTKEKLDGGTESAK
jgi:hypothetical protein